MNRRIMAGACLLVASALGSVNAQEGVLAELYGQGVHAYFSNDPLTAHGLFTSAIEQGSRDPRCYYYRALCYAQLGRPDEAELDLKTGAEVEYAVTDRVYPVADSLQRVQGSSRMKIEKHRQTARLASFSKASQIQKVRYEQMKRAEQDVLRNPTRSSVPAPPAAGVVPPAAATGAEEMAEKTDPFAGDTEVKPEKAPEKPAEPATAPPAEADPFGAPAAAPATPAEDAKTDPFADDKPAAAAAPPAPAANDDPFK